MHPIMRSVVFGPLVIRLFSIRTQYWDLLTAQLGLFMFSLQFSRQNIAKNIFLFIGYSCLSVYHYRGLIT